VKLRQLRGLAAATVAAALVLTGCSADKKDPEATTSSSSSDTATEAPATSAADAKILEGVTYSAATANAAPTDFKIDADLNTLSGASVIKTSEGTGDEIKAGDVVVFNYVALSTDGEILESTYEGQGVVAANDTQATVGVLVNALTGSKVGARFTFATPGVAATDDAAAVDPNLMILEVESVAPNTANGEDQKVEDDSLPKVTLDDAGKASVEIPEGFKAADTDKVQVVVLKKGAGEVVAETDTIAAQYTGWSLNGKQFDSSWDRGTASVFSLSEVIKGWTQGLSGQTVGSQVLLIIPGALGYGEGESDGSQSPPVGDLVFVVDILAKG